MRYFKRKMGLLPLTGNAKLDIIFVYKTLYTKLYTKNLASNKETFMDSITLKAYAKINLGLDVLRRLENGYHEVKMVMQNVGIYDELTLMKTPLDITVETDHAELPADENNLVYKAAKLMFEEFRLPGGLHIQLEKNIPIAAGMAGGSTDAAAVMKGIRELYGLDVSTKRLMELSVSIGADVPYCILGGTALSQGIGEILTPLSPMPQCHILVAKPDINVSTKFVYEHLDAQGVDKHPDIDAMVAAIQAGNLPGILPHMENVLETVTIPAHPIIKEIKQLMITYGAHASLMSGSGPTVFGIFTEYEKAQSAYEKIKATQVAKQIFLTTPIA